MNTYHSGRTHHASGTNWRSDPGRPVNAMLSPLRMEQLATTQTLITPPSNPYHRMTSPPPAVLQRTQCHTSPPPLTCKGRRAFIPLAPKCLICKDRLRNPQRLTSPPTPMPSIPLVRAPLSPRKPTGMSLLHGHGITARLIARQRHRHQSSHCLGATPRKSATNPCTRKLQQIPFL